MVPYFGVERSGTESKKMKKSSTTFEHFDSKTQQKLANETSLKRWGDTTDVANTCSLIVSDNFSFVNGQTIVIDGGNVLL